MKIKGTRADYSDSHKSMKPGGGGRFQKLEGELSQEKGIRDPGALAASIGRKKYGKAKFQGFAAKGK